MAAAGIGPDQVHAALAGVDFGAIAGLVSGLLVGLAGALSNLALTLLLFMGLDAAGFPARLEPARDRERGTRS